MSTGLCEWRICYTTRKLIINSGGERRVGGGSRIRDRPATVSSRRHLDSKNTRRNSATVVMTSSSYRDDDVIVFCDRASKNHVFSDAVNARTNVVLRLLAMCQRRQSMTASLSAARSDGLAMRHV